MKTEALAVHSLVQQTPGALLRDRNITVHERERNPALKEQAAARGRATDKQTNRYMNQIIYESGSCSDKTWKCDEQESSGGSGRTPQRGTF